MGVMRAHLEAAHRGAVIRIKSQQALIRADATVRPETRSDARVQHATLARAVMMHRSAADSIKALQSWRADGVGYNPNRDKGGRFAPGPHATPKRSAPSGIGRAPRFNDVPHRAQIAVHKSEEHGHRREVLRIKAEQSALRAQARGKTASERRALREAHALLGQAKEAHRSHANAAKERRVLASKAMGEARREHGIRIKVQRMVATDPRRATIAHDPLEHTRLPADLVDKVKLHTAQFSVTAQQAARDHHNAVLAMYGLHHRAWVSTGDNAKLTGNVEVRTTRGMGSWGGGNDGAVGLHYDRTGLVALDIKRADGLRNHAGLNATELRTIHSRYDDKSAEMAYGYHVMTHEAVHEHGPDVMRVGHHTMAEEMTTEMVARRVVSDVHNVHVSTLSGSYGRYIYPTIHKISELSGAREADAFDALASASIRFKQSSGNQISPSDALFGVGKNALLRLGVSDPKAHQALYDHMTKISDEGP